jgi:hypothetical protein
MLNAPEGMLRAKLGGRKGVRVYLVGWFGRCRFVLENVVAISAKGDRELVVLHSEAEHGLFPFNHCSMRYPDWLWMEQMARSLTLAKGGFLSGRRYLCMTRARSSRPRWIRAA